MELWQRQIVSFLRECAMVDLNWRPVELQPSYRIIIRLSKM